MLKIITLATISALALAVTVTSKPAFAGDGGAVAAGVVGGLAVGAIIGSQAQHNNYNGPTYVEQPEYVGERHYRARYRDCHVERQEISDAYGNYRVRRIRVCD
jgi:hypothetical protein